MDKKKIIIGILIGIAILISFILAYKSNYDSFPKNVKEIEKSIVIIKLKDIENPTSPYNGDLGTGFFVDKRGYVITAEHNFAHTATTLTKEFNLSITRDELIELYGYISFISKSGERRDVKIIRVANETLEQKDVILLKMDEIYLFDAVKIANKKEIEGKGIEVGFIGYTKTLDISPNLQIFVNKGVLSKEDLEVIGQKSFYSINSLAARGNSGAPVFLAKNGKVIGILEGPSPDESGLQRGIIKVPPIHDVPEIIKNLNKEKK